jgi:transcriptional regulator of acetoin/glycerol metabolism
VAPRTEIAPTDLGLAGGEPPALAQLAPGEQAEREELLRLLAAEVGNVSRVAEALGITRQALYRRMARLGVELERRPR